jgi:hypothetical protein
MVYKHPVFTDECKMLRGADPCDLHTFELDEGCGTHYSGTSPYRFTQRLGFYAATP